MEEIIIEAMWRMYADGDLSSIVDGDLGFEKKRRNY